MLDGSITNSWLRRRLRQASHERGTIGLGLHVAYFTESLWDNAHEAGRVFIQQMNHRLIDRPAEELAKSAESERSLLWRFVNVVNVLTSSVTTTVFSKGVVTESLLSTSIEHARRNELLEDDLAYRLESNVAYLVFAAEASEFVKESHKFNSDLAKVPRAQFGLPDRRFASSQKALVDQKRLVGEFRALLDGLEAQAKSLAREHNG